MITNSLGDQNNQNNNCNLVGTDGLAVQMILIALIFIAVKGSVDLIERNTTSNDLGGRSNYFSWMAPNNFVPTG